MYALNSLVLPLYVFNASTAASTVALVFALVVVAAGAAAGAQGPVGDGLSRWRTACGYGWRRRAAEQGL